MAANNTENSANKINVLCLVSYNILPAKMGGQKGIASFYTFFAQWVNIVCVATKSNDPSYANYKVLNILSNSILRYINIFYFFTLRRVIKQYNITHLQIEHPYYGWLAIMLQKLCRVKLILHSHNIEGERFKSTGKWWASILLGYEKLVHKCCDYLFFVTEEDRQYSISKFGVKAAKCLTTPYGIEWQHPPAEAERIAAKQALQQQYGFKPNDTILFINGTFSYKPNLDALVFVLDKLNPLLVASKMQYKVVVCGKGIPSAISNAQHPNVTIAGFVDDISIYFKGADIFLNPLATGGGIKTKLVEALGYDLYVASLRDGAIGIPAGVTGDKMVVVDDDNDVEAFANAVIALQSKTGHIPAAYFDYFYWGDITKRAAGFIS